MSDDHDPLASEIVVPSEDPKQKDKDKDQPRMNGDVKGKGKDESSDEPEIVCLAPSHRFTKLM